MLTIALKHIFIKDLFRHSVIIFIINIKKQNDSFISGKIVMISTFDTYISVVNIG